MRIVFLCGGLGLGGVADYTRHLARALRAHGVQSLIVGLADRDATATSRHSDESMTALALPAAMPWPRRIGEAEGALKTFAPDWISLQFVPFAFNRKGVVALESRWLRRLLAGARPHLMMHELWIEPLPRPVPIRRRLLRAAQRVSILRLLRDARPLLLHTNNAVYQRLLEEAGLSARLLPLFGNVPIVAKPDRAWLDAALAQAGIDLARRPLLFGFFGGINPEWDAAPLLSRIAQALRRLGRPGVLLSAGAAGAIGERLRGWRRHYPDLGFLALGVQPLERISAYLQALDFGLTSYPYALIGKSGSVLAMLEHGLPVIVSWGDLVSDLPALEPSLGLSSLVLTPSGDLERFIAAPPERRIRGSLLPQVAAAMVHDLESATRRQKGE